jgi:hypothetical protein
MATPSLSVAEAQGMWTGWSRAWRVHCLERVNCSHGFYFKPKRELNQTKQIGKYIFMENIFYQQGSNSHPEGLSHCYMYAGMCFDV